jgi:hypothetical protein
VVIAKAITAFFVWSAATSPSFMWKNMGDNSYNATRKNKTRFFEFKLNALSTIIKWIFIMAASLHFSVQGQVRGTLTTTQSAPLPELQFQQQTSFHTWIIFTIPVPLLKLTGINL